MPTKSTAHSAALSIDRGLTVFFVALIVRFILGYLFFGSIDTVIARWVSQAIFLGQTPPVFFDHRPLLVPYFPVYFNLMGWHAVLNGVTSLPLGFCYKIFQMVFDAAIAWMIYQSMCRRDESEPAAFKTAMFYALCPVSILISTFQGQWESIFIYFVILGFWLRDMPQWQRSRLRLCAAGIFYAFSIAAKPIAVILLPLFFWKPADAHDTGRGRTGALGWMWVGFIGFWTLYLSILNWRGFDCGKIFFFISTYANGGVVCFGLPVAPPFDQLSFLHHRNWLLLVVGLIFLLYVRLKMEVEEAILLTWLALYSFSGLTPQYLFWAIPFLLLTRRYRMAAALNLVWTIFLVCWFYKHLVPLGDHLSIGRFFTLKDFVFLMPPVHRFDEACFAVMLFLGTYGIPFTALFCAGRVAMDQRKKRSQLTKAPGNDSRPSDRFGRVVGFHLVLIAVIGIPLFWENIDFYKHLVSVSAVKMRQYYIYDEKAAVSSVGHAVWNIAVFILAGALLWSVLIYRGFKKNIRACIGECKG